MQFQILSVAVAFLASSVTANMNARAICRTFDDLLTQRAAFDRNATMTACKQYRERNTGPEKWDSCPDCFYNEHEGVQAFCDSKLGRMGGKEWEQYCIEAGAGGAYAITN